MIKFKKLLIMLSFSFLLMTLTLPLYPMESFSHIIHQNQRIDNFEWRYKVIDGKLYRRLFNVTAQKWAGDWEQAF